MEIGGQNVGRRGTKSPEAFRTISEVASELDMPQHVLRFWETKFPQVKPLKRGGGRRYYRPEDIDLLRKIRRLLYCEGYTIKGVQKILRENTSRAGLAPSPNGLRASDPSLGGLRPGHPRLDGPRSRGSGQAVQDSPPTDPRVSAKPHQQASNAPSIPSLADRQRLEKVLEELLAIKALVADLSK